MLPHVHFAKTGEYGHVVDQITDNVKKKGAAAKLPLNVRNIDGV